MQLHVRLGLWQRRHHSRLPLGLLCMQRVLAVMTARILRTGTDVCGSEWCNGVSYHYMDACIGLQAALMRLLLVQLVHAHHSRKQWDQACHQATSNTADRPTSASHSITN